MKIIKKNLKKQELVLRVENPDDVWVLSQIVEPGDIIRGKTERKIKIGDSDDRNQKIVRKQVFLSIVTEKSDMSEGQLRVLGVINDGPDDIARGEHHSFKLEPNTVFTIEKKRWLNYQLDKISEAAKTKQPKLLIVIFDREEAFFAKLKGHGYELLATMRGDVSKKETKHLAKGDFYKEITQKISDYIEKGEVEQVIVASPGFWKEALLKELPDEIKKKTISATVSQATERAIPELMKRPEVQTVLERSRAAQETNLVEELLRNISSDTACYGMDETAEKVSIGAVKDLLLSYDFLQKKKEEDDYERLEQIMLGCEQTSGRIHIISSDETKKTLNSLAGIAGILRWKSS